MPTQKRRIERPRGMPHLVDAGSDVLFYPTRFPSNEVKDILGGRWMKDEAAWKLRCTSHNVENLVDWYGRDILEGAPQRVWDCIDEGYGFQGFKVHKDLLLEAQKKARWEDLFPYQKKAVEYMVCNPHNGCLLDLPPGRGKTAAAVFAASVLGARRILVTAPMSLAPDWIDGFNDWYDGDIDVKRATPEDPLPGPEVTITHHEVLQHVLYRDEDGQVVKDPQSPRAMKEWIANGPKKYDAKTGKSVPARERIVQARPEYAELEWDAIILDESIMVKNRKAVKLKVLKQLVKYSHQVWLMSGSPTAQGRQDLHSQLQLIDPKSWSSYWRFVEFFCNVSKDQWGWSITGDAPGVNIHTFLRDYIFTPDPKDLHELPDYHYWSPKVDMTPKQRKVFTAMVEDWCASIDGVDNDTDEWDVSVEHHLALQTRLLQITSNLANVDPKMRSESGKLEFLIDLMKEGKVQTPLLIWTWFIPTAQATEERLRKEFKKLRIAGVYGPMKRDDKEGTIKAYKQGELDVLILQMNIGKYGHTLINTQTIYYHDRTYDSDAAVQSLWRTRRVGLKHRPVLITPKLNDSADALVDANLEGKMPSISEASRIELRSLLLALIGR